MSGLGREFREAFRLLVRSPAFVAAVVLPLALALGANTALFTVIRGVLLRPLPYPEPERLVRVYRGGPSGEGGRYPLSALNLREDIAGVRTLGSLAAWAVGSASLAGDGPAEHLRVGQGTASLLQVLGVIPSLGRWFGPEEEDPQRDHRIVVSHALWTRRLGGDPAALGRTLMLDGEPYQVVGVLPSGVELPELCDAWVPLSFEPMRLQPPARNWHYLRVVARLAPGSSLESARRELAERAQRTLADHPEAYSLPFVFAPLPMREDMVRSVQPMLVLLFGAVALVLVMSGVNVGNLLLARSMARRKELAIRSALGARRSTLVRQLLVESLLLSGAAGVLGVLMAASTTGALLALAPQAVPRAEAVHLDALVLVFAAGITGISGVVFGLVPALFASEIDLEEALRGSASMRPRGRTLRRILVTVDVGLALVLLCAASLLLRSFVLALGVDPGFRADGVVTFQTAFPMPSEMSEQAETRRLTYHRRAVESLRALPGVDSAGAVSVLPLSQSISDRLLEIEGDPAGPGREMTSEEYRVVTPGLFETLRIPLLKGRTIEATDTASAPPVVVVNESFVRRRFPGGEALGKRLRLTSPAGAWTTVVGVVGDVREFGLDRPVQPIMYFPFAQQPTDGMSFVVRSSAGYATTSRAAASALQALDPEIPTFAMRPYQSFLSASMAERRFSLVLVACFALLAVVLAAVGLYGVVAYSVRQRTKEIGVRMAVGADRGRIALLVAGESARMVGVGLAAGLVGALAAARLLGGFLYGVGPADPLAMMGAALVLATAATLATVLPVRRATRVDPVVALAAE